MVTGTLLLLYILGALLVIIIGCSVFKWHPLLVLTCTSLLLGIAVGMPIETVLQTVGQGAGSTFASIGLVIAFGTILGEAIERSGATQSLANAVVGVFGKKRVITSVSLLGGVVGIPVFCDSGFIILSNLARSLARETKTSYGALSIALASGLYTTHVLIPPTPGPMAAAANLGAADQLGMIILLGLLVGIPPILIGNYMARLVQKSEQQHEITSEVETEAVQPVAFWRSVTPLLLPILLITLGSLIPFLPSQNIVVPILRFICNPIVALLLSVIVSFLILPLKGEKNTVISKALAQAGSIILITAAGGAFGAVLKTTPLAEVFSNLISQNQFSTLAVFPIAYLISAGLKTAQGSSTASLIITSSFLAPLLPVLGMDQPGSTALLVLAIGAGAMSVSHANDSYFWVVQQYSGLTVKKMYRYFTLTTFFMGLSVLVSVMLLFLLINTIRG